LKKSGEDLAQVVNAGGTAQNIDDDDDNDWFYTYRYVWFMVYSKTLVKLQTDL